MSADGAWHSPPEARQRFDTVRLDLRDLPPLENPAASRGLATQLARALEEAVRLGILRQGMRLPGPDALGRRYDVSHDTAVRAVKLLCDRGVARHAYGTGYFVRGEAHDA